jgi:hypothetical protein
LLYKEDIVLYIGIRDLEERDKKMQSDYNVRLETGKCRKCKYTRIYDFTDSGFSGAPCENCGAESNQIVLIKEEAN